MKKITFIAVGLLLIGSFSCKETKKNPSEGSATETTEMAEQFALVKDSTKVSFTAYKTTGKVPVGGEFKEINISNDKKGATPLETLDGVAFSIPVSSLFTNDATGTRDPKILEFFFGVMKDTELISGVFKVGEGDACSIDVTLNGETSNIPLTHKMVSETKLSFDGTMELENWKALDAVASINKACEALHTGEDGVSKTWSEVAVHAEVLLEKTE
ncbi:hypothetical protein [Pseudozobellia thermophila]|uniref:YceI-like domain-containing protein n=1 Tax=Pseudozobellia thermophila TaxID=192903 RepID=A0A1M6FKV2_9FLAO|nr:hypothetical protein [Pseudozobellia thermophila]SHI98283.1 hypothetical protein SAMN04488513_102468 [Pseudozobellia thermophila]